MSGSLFKLSPWGWPTAGRQIESAPRAADELQNGTRCEVVFMGGGWRQAQRWETIDKHFLDYIYRFYLL